MAPVKAIGKAAAAISMSILSIFLCKSLYNLSMRKFRRRISKTKARKGLIDSIGNTPFMRINSLSDATGCEILAKAEFLNPGGSVKDRVAVKIIEEGRLAQGIRWDRIAFGPVQFHLAFGEDGKELRGLDLQTGSFTLRQIKAATNNFDPVNKIGEGGFGPVYEGLLSDGNIIAMKQLSS